jgi:hypothetical protein
MNRFLPLLLMLFVVGTGRAQDNAKPWVFSGGYTVGTTLAQVRGDGIEGFNKVGFHAGGLIEVRKFSDLGFQLGLVYNQKGSRKVPNLKTGDGTDWRYQFTYIDIPLVAVYDFSEGFTVGTGLQPAVLISALEDGVSNGGYSTGAWQDTKLPIRSWEFSWVVWVGMRTDKQGEWFLRHTQSLPGIVPKPSANNNAGLRWDDRMQNLTMQLGYTRLFGGRADS